jgi:chromosomal replication initiator protein
MTVQIDKEKLWQATLGELELNLSKANFTTWFRNTFIVDVRGDEVVVGVPNAFTKAWLENKYHKHILGSLSHISNNAITNAQYQVAQKGREASIAAPQEPPEQKVAAAEGGISEGGVATPKPEKDFSLNKYGLNPRYTFDGFIVGKANQLAHAAAQAAAQKPGEVYNPLFIYGGSGMGKTHLMQAIGHSVLTQWPNKNVIYVSCEKFTNEFINAISHGKADSFKNKYRSADVLLIDDVQFLANKEGTQEEFFHTFNALHQANHQIVLSSDRPPKAIRGLEDRLVSRFEWGMLVDLPQPDLETRTAILEMKCRERQYTLSNDVISYIARHIQSNIRELEGVLNRIIAYHNLNNAPATLDSVKQLLQTQHQHNSQKHRALTSKDILNVVVNYFGISQANLTGASRQKELVVPRQITMFLLREELKCSYPTIGQEIGGRDHTTAMHAYEKIRIAFDEDEKIRRDITQIRQRLYE